MEGNKIDQAAGGAGSDDLKSQAGPGSDKGGADVAGLKSKIDELLTETKRLKAENEQHRSEKAKREEDESKKKGDYESLLKKKDEALVGALSQIKNLTIENKARAHGLIDPDYTEILAKKVKDDFSNLDEVLTELKGQKPYLFGSTESTTPKPPATDTSKGKHPAAGRTLTPVEVANLSDTAYADYRKEQLAASPRFGVRIEHS